MRKKAEHTNKSNKYDPEMIAQIKSEVLKDLKERQEWKKEYDTNTKPPVNSKRTPRELDYDLWTDRENYDYVHNKKQLRKQLRSELIATEKIQRQIDQVKDPYVRQTLCELLNEAQKNGIEINELVHSLDMNERYEYGTFWDYLPAPFRYVDRKSFSWGATAALAGLLLLPTVSKSFKSVIKKTLEESMELSERAQGVFSQAKEELEDIVAEAQFNKLKNSISNQIDNPNNKQ